MNIAVGSLAIVASITILMGISLYLPFSAGDLFLLPIGTMAVGAYGYGWLATHGHGTAVSVVGALLAALVLAALVGWFVLPFRGLGSSLVTLGMVQIIGIVLVNFSPLGGSLGLPGIPGLTAPAPVIAVTVVVVVLVAVLEWGRRGHVIRAIRADDLAAECCGTNTKLVRYSLNVASGLVSGAAGVIAAGFLTYIDPTQFDISALNSYLPAPLLGGSTTILGALLGGIVTGVVPQLIQALQTYQVIVYSALVVLVLVVRREGLVTIDQVERFGRFLRRGRSATSGGTPDTSWDGAVVELAGVRKRFGGVQAVADVSLTARPGEVLGIIGPNGAGKTTLLNIISGVDTPDSGTIHIDGAEFTANRPHRTMRRGIARTFQNLRLYPRMTVRQNVEIVSRSGAAGAIATLGLTARSDDRVGGLSYGYQRRVEIARALAGRPRALLLDEPTAGMTGQEAEEIGQIVRDLKAGGLTLVLIEHNMTFLTSVADRVVVLDAGAVIARGSATEVQNDPAVIEAYLGTSAVPAGTGARSAAEPGQEDRS